MNLTPSLYLGPDELLLIGSVISWWSACEHMLFDDVMLARTIPSVAAAGVAWPMQVQAKKLITQWRDVANILKEEFDAPTDLDDLRRRLMHTNWTRNLIVHGFYDHDLRLGRNTVSLLQWDADLGTFVNQPFLIDGGVLSALCESAEQLHDDLNGWSELIHSKAKARASKDPKAAAPKWPEVLDLAPKPLPI